MSVTRQQDERILPIHDGAAPSVDVEALSETVRFEFEMARRGFMQTLGAGVLITIGAQSVIAQRRGRRARPSVQVSARIHLGENGVVTVLSGKTEMGQGARAQLAQAAAEELRLPVGQLQLVLADTAITPDDGSTAGSRTTPQTVPAVRRAAAAAREVLTRHASEKWGVGSSAVEVREGRAMHPAGGESISYGDLAGVAEVDALLAQPAPDDVQLTSVDDWQVLGTSYTATNRVDFVTGRHKYPTDHTRPGMLYGRVLRPASYGAALQSIDLSVVDGMEGAVAVRDGDFVGVVAPSLSAANAALDAIAETASWDSPAHPSSDELYQYLRNGVEAGALENPLKAEVDGAAQSLAGTYEVAYVQHAPLEPRVALAEWTGDDKLTVWTGTQNPFGYRRELAGAFRIAEEAVRVVVPDFGSGYGGKHTGEAAIEAARLARGAGKPVLLRWNREEEFTWAYFRPAGVIDVKAGLDDQNRIGAWYHVNINSGGSAVDTPYEVGRDHCRSVRVAKAPLRQGSYRALASTANAFARESFMDELAHLVGVDPLEFRLAHLEEGRLRDVLEDAAQRFGWRERVAAKHEGRGVGLACATEKGSFVAACVEIEIGRRNAIEVVEVCQTFECGKVQNPDNLLRQVEGAIVQGLGPALTEEITFSEGKVTNASFRRNKYEPPRMDSIPQMNSHLLDRPDLASVGGGETPLIAVAPAIANAVFHATGQRLRRMPLKLA